MSYVDMPLYIREKVQRFIKGIGFCVTPEKLVEYFLIKVSSLIYDLESLYRLNPRDVSNILSQALISEPVLALLSKIKNP